MAIVVQILSTLVGIAWLVCFILVVVQMFQHNEKGIGIASIVLAICCGIGGLVAFVYGWMKAREWNIMNIMLAWTGVWVIGIVLGIINFAVSGFSFSTSGVFPPPR